MMQTAASRVLASGKAPTLTRSPGPCLAGMRGEDDDAPTYCWSLEPMFRTARNQSWPSGLMSS